MAGARCSGTVVGRCSGTGGRCSGTADRSGAAETDRSVEPPARAGAERFGTDPSERVHLGTDQAETEAAPKPRPWTGGR
jgi:hypothetical protein